MFALSCTIAAPPALPILTVRPSPGMGTAAGDTVMAWRSKAHLACFAGIAWATLAVERARPVPAIVAARRAALGISFFLVQVRDASRRFAPTEHAVVGAIPAARRDAVPSSPRLAREVPLRRLQLPTSAGCSPGLELNDLGLGSLSGTDTHRPGARWIVPAGMPLPG